MSNVTDLYKALRQGVATLNGTIGNLPVAVNNVDFDGKPTNGSPWLRMLIETGTPVPRAVGVDEYSGYLQLDVNTKLQAGESAADTICQSAANYFKAGRVLQYSGTDAVVRSCARSMGREVDGWWRTTLTVYWDARIDRPA